MPVILNKIDPVIISNVHQQTAEEVVHTSKKVRVSKDREKGSDNQSSGRRMKDKVDKFNSILGLMDIDVSLSIDGDSVAAVDSEGNVLKRYNRDALIELMNSMEDMIGVFIDIRK